MKKVPTLFVRDEANRSRVTTEPNLSCAWVFEGEGVPTIKLDGTACMVRNGKLYKRHELRPGKNAPAGFEQADEDPATGKRPGWVPVGDGAEDKWHRQAFHGEPDGTYELMGPKVQRNTLNFSEHRLFMHGYCVQPVVERTYEGIRRWLERHPQHEGLVFHHPDGRWAKIKRRDFGLDWPIKSPEG